MYSLVGKSSLQKRLTNNPSQIFESFIPHKQYDTLARCQNENYYIYYSHETNDRSKYIGNPWDVVLVCFSTECYATLQKAKHWIRTARNHKNNIIILLGLKTDIRNHVLEENDPEELIGLVSYEQAYDVALRYKCLGYVECSSKTKEGFNELIEMIINGKAMSYSTTSNRHKKTSSFGSLFKIGWNI